MSKKQGLFYGNTPKIFGWASIILHNIIIVGIMMADGYKIIDVNMKAINDIFVRVFIGYFFIFVFLRKRYEKKYGKFESEYHIEYQHSSFMQFLFCLYEYATGACIMSIWWMFFLHK